MRLLNTTTLKLHEFIGGGIPVYAILSHTWGDGEVSFENLRDEKGPNMAGYAKIEGCCSQALKDGYECTRGRDDGKSPCTRSNFRKSRWFTRVWTLQELIAPEAVVFYDHDWVEIGTRSYLRNLISSIIHIDGIANLNLDQASVAQKKSWASQRDTTREEDIAYCLMGIFGVNMPLYYGEGRKAFKRLQEEIIKTSTDESIFVWESIDRNGVDVFTSTHGMLASYPYQFRHSHDIVEFEVYKERLPYSVTNKGFGIEFLIYQVGNCIRVPLNCCDSETYKRIVLSLVLSYNGMYTRKDSLFDRAISKLGNSDIPGIETLEKTYLCG